nr:SusF/SusE family outer membrane protein [uncultured Carboxylicivirga sp.]
MRHFNIYALLILLLGLFASCEDEDKVQVPADAVKPVLTAPDGGGTYVLEKVNEEEVFKTFEWSAADFNIPVVEEYSIEVDATGGDFSSYKVIANSITSPYEITVGDFNKAMLAAGFTDGEAHDIILRISANHHLSSETIEMNVTTYFDAEPWTVIGSAVGGWDLENDQYMTYDKDNDVYTITLDMVPGDFKFRAPKKDSDPWKFNYGLSGDSEVIEDAQDVELESGGSNIQTLGGNYTITLDVTNEKFSIVQNSAGDLTNWTDVVLDAVGTGVSADNANASADGSSWNWGNVLLPDNEGKPASNGTTFTWTWTGVVLEAEEGFKLRTLNGEAAPENGISFDVGYAALDVENSTDQVVDKDGNFSVSTKGEYTITLEIDAASGDTKKVTIVEYSAYPAHMYMIGASIGGWTWGENDIEMIPVHSNPHLFWRIVWIEKGVQDAGLKFSEEQAWGKDFGVSGEAVDGVYAKGSDNVPDVYESGYYMVVVNLREETIEITTPSINGIGGVFGDENWNGGIAFTVDNANKVITSPAFTGNGELRMYATALTMTNKDGDLVDWWQAEFIALNDVIEYRGVGDDQERLNVTAGQSISLDFINGTGTLQ